MTASIWHDWLPGQPVCICCIMGDFANEFLSSITICEDISTEQCARKEDLRATHAELRQVHEELKQVLQTATGAMAIYEPDGRLRMMNEAMRRMVGLTESQSTGWS